MKEPSLYSSLLSANGGKVEAIVQYLDLKIHIKNINIYAGEGQSPAYIAINSLGQIPSYEDADICLHESNVILLYLSQQSPEINLAGDTPAQQAIISSWLLGK